jgi:chorismate synthase
MTKLRYLTAGESHGPHLTTILEGMLAGLPLSESDLLEDMARRQTGFGRGGRMSIEQDRAQITAGVMNGQTTGGPISMTIANKDWANWAKKNIDPFTVPRPGHADLTAAIKYGYRDLRIGLERASARETAARVAIGAVCKQLLRQFGITVQGYVTMIGGVSADLPDETEASPYLQRFENAETSEVRCPDKKASSAMKSRIKEAVTARDTLGGVFEIVALGVPPGLGSHVHSDRRLSARLFSEVGSIQAIKGVEIGAGFAQAAQMGTEVHDPIIRAEDGSLTRPSNRAGGLEGGITTGMPLLVRAAMKPISTTLTPIASVDLASGETHDTVYERSDICAVPRAVVVGEAAVAFVLADALLEKLGGDNFAEAQPRFESLRRSHVNDLPMDNAPWRFGYSERDDSDGA